MRILIPVVLVLIQLTSGEGVFAAEVSTFKYKDGSVYAAFESRDPSGCIRTSVFVAALQSAIRMSAGSSIETPIAAVTISQVNSCTGIQLIQAAGDTPTMIFDHRASLQSATLSSTIPVYDFETDRFYDVVVNLAWEGTSPVIVDGSTSGAFPDQGFQTMLHAQTQYRTARASGTVSDGVTNLTPTNSYDAQIQNVKFGEVAISRPE
jgi:hypothetical protein